MGMPASRINGEVVRATTPVLSWSDDGSPGTFGVYRGSRPAATAWSYNQQCLGTVVATSTSDASTPGLQATYYYLITRKTACGESVAGRNGQGAPVPNDAPCP